MLVELVVELHTERVVRVEREHAPERLGSFRIGATFESRARFTHCNVELCERVLRSITHPTRFHILSVRGEKFFRLRERRRVVPLLEASRHELLLARNER